ncbi:MAG: ferritin-like domain-containing protein [Proteobacteria bacterium]|nr:ferritin-like domain-containing protein [Pseudomonadota bacterium]
MVNMDIDFLKRALEIEEKAYTNARAAYEFHKNNTDSTLSNSLKEIMDDEKEHVSLIKQMIEKKGKNLK